MDTNFAAYVDTYQCTHECAIEHTQQRPYMYTNFAAYVDTYQHTDESAHRCAIEHTQ